MKKLLAVILLIAMTLSFTPVFAEGTPVQLALTSNSASLDSISLTFNKEIAFDVFKSRTTITTSGNTVGVSMSTTDNKTITITPKASFELGKKYVLSSALVFDAEKRTMIQNFRYELDVVKLFEDNFDGYTTNDEFAETYTLRGSGQTHALTNLQLARTSYADRGTYIADVQDGKMHIHVNPGKINDSYNNWFVSPRVADESAFDNYILEYTVENGNSAIMDMVARQGASFYDGTGLFYRTMSGNNYIVLGSLKNYVGTAPLTDNKTKVKIVMGGYDASNDLLEIYHDGVLKDRRINVGKYGSTSGSFGFRCANAPSVDLIIDDIKAYKVKTLTSGSYASIDSFWDVEITTASYANGSEVACNVVGYDPSEGFDISYKWYIGKNENAYPQKSEDWEEAGCTADKYTITNENKYVKCVVTQSKNGVPIIEYESDPMFKEVPPMAMNANIVRKDENTLTAEYTYFDANRDAELNTTVEWLTSTDKKNWTSVKSTTVSDGDSPKDVDFNVTDLTDVFLKCVIVPKSAKADYGDTVELFYTLPFKPVASNVKITGNGTKGSVLTATYDYYDENGDSENESKTLKIWYRISGSKKTQVGTGLAYSVTKADEGCKLVFEVTPKNGAYPENDKAYASNEISVKSSGNSSSKNNSYTSKNEVSEAPKDDNTFVYIPEPEPTALQDVVGHWAEKEIRELYKKEIIKGRENGFEPNSDITRAEWLTLLYRASGIDTGKVSYKKSFDDVSEDSWYAKVISDAYSKKLIKGDNGKFNPDESLTREQMAKMLIDMLEYVNGKKSEASDDTEFFDNAEISEWAEEYISKAVGDGLMNGTPENKFEPKKNATRAEASAVLLRFMKLIEQEG